MIITFLQRLLWLVVLVAAQMMVFSHIHILGYATPLPFVYLLLLFPLGTERWSIMLWGFACGLLTDVVLLTPGVGSAAMTLTAFVQPPLLRLMAPKDAVEDMQASYASMGFWSYMQLAALLTFLFALTYFLLLAFNFFHFVDLAISLSSSWLLTLVLCLVFEGMRTREKKN